MRSANRPHKPLELLPFALWPAFPAADYYESSASPSRIGATFPWHLNGPSPVHMSDSNALVRLPVAIFTLACRKSMQTSRASDALHAAPSYRATYTTAHRNLMRTCHQLASTFHLLSRVGEGDISAHRYELTGSCSSTFQCSA